VVRGHVIDADALGQLARHPLRQAARVDEDKRGSMRLDQLGQALVDLLPHLGRHHGLKRRLRKFEGEVTPTAVAGIDDGAVDAGGGARVHPHQETSDRLDRLLGRRKAHALQVVAAERRQPLERKRQMGATLVGGDRVDLVDDHRAGRRQHRTARLRAEQDVERLGRRHHDVRRPAAHAVALAGRGVARAHPGADVHLRQTLRLEALADAGKRRFQVALDVVRQRLERRDVDDLGFVLEAAVEALPHQAIDGGEKGRQRLARPGRGGNQHVPAGLEGRPRLCLCRRGRGKAALKPGGNGRMKQGTWRHGAELWGGRCGGGETHLRHAPWSATYGFLAHRINPRRSRPRACAPVIRG